MQSQEYKKYLRRNQTEPEKQFWNLVRNKQVRGLKFRRQHQVGKYIVDFYCPSVRLIVEIDGETHASEAGKLNDNIRTRFLQSHGYKVVRYTNREVIGNLDGVYQDLLKQLNPLPTSPQEREVMNTPKCK